MSNSFPGKKGELFAAAAFLLLFVAFRIPSGISQEKSPGPAEKKAVTFKADIAPLLKTNCIPCHFEGGKVFDRYPFTQYETVRKLGKRLNTRLKGESAILATRWIENGSPDH